MSDNLLEMHHVEFLREAACFIPRKQAHNILLAATGLMRTELDNCSEDVIYKSLADRPWQPIVAGVDDKIRKDLVGPGIIEFKLEMCRNAPGRDPMAVFVAVRVDGQKVIHHPHADRDEPLQFEDEDADKFQRPPTKDEIVKAFRRATHWAMIWKPRQPRKPPGSHQEGVLKES